MYPIICKIGPATIYSYGLMFAIAVIVCAFLLRRDAQKCGIKTDMIFDFVFWVIVGGILGARSFYVLLNFDFFFQYPLEIIMIQNGGLAWQGGFLFGVIAAVWFIKFKKLPFLKMVDLIAPYLALGQAIGRVGCFLNGCCFGKPVSWGIYFPSHADHIHPTQLYSTAGLLLVFFILKQFQKTSRIHGQVFVLYLILASALRFVIEFFRADHELIFIGLSIYQIICLGLILIALYGCAYLKSQSRK